MRLFCLNEIEQPLKNVVPIIMVMFLTAALPNIGIAEVNELLYKICFPKEEPAATKVEECKDEDCGLKDEVREEPAPTIEKSQRFTFLGATDYGEIWGADNYRVIGDDRVRFLLYVVPTVTTKITYYEKGCTLVPDSVIKTAFFSSYEEYQGSSVSITYDVKKKVVQKKEVSGGTPVLQMIDLHCSARKMKIYDNHTLYFRQVENQHKERLCVELLWEKPEAPLRWQPVSPMTMDILTGFYCKGKK